MTEWQVMEVESLCEGAIPPQVPLIQEQTEDFVDTIVVVVVAV